MVEPPVYPGRNRISALVLQKESIQVDGRTSRECERAPNLAICVRHNAGGQTPLFWSAQSPVIVLCRDTVTRSKVPAFFFLRSLLEATFIIISPVTVTAASCFFRLNRFLMGAVAIFRVVLALACVVAPAQSWVKQKMRAHVAECASKTSFLRSIRTHTNLWIGRGIHQGQGL